MKQNYYILLFLCLISATNIFSQIVVNEGTIRIKTSTIVYFGDEYTNNGIHSNDGDLYLNSNFINNDSTSAIAGTTFFNSSINTIQSISGSKNKANFYNLVIDNDLLGVEVVDNFGLIVNNAVNLMTGDLRLVGEAQLIQTHPGTDANTAIFGSLLRDQQGTSSTYGYNYWSSPVNNGGAFSLSGGLFDGTDSSINSFTPQQILFTSGSPYNGAPSTLDGGGNVTTPLTINTSWLYTYLIQSLGFVKIDENSTISPGEGYLMKGTNTVNSNQNYVFKGVPNDGDYQLSVNAGEYIIIGNPYPSAIDIDEFIKDNVSISEGGYAPTDVINGTVYFWVEGGSTSHNYIDYFGGYATRNLIGGVAPSGVIATLGGLGTSEFVSPPEQYMAVSQGFMVEAADGGNVSFKNSQRIFKTESSGSSINYKDNNPKSDTEKSIIRIGYEDPEGFHRQLILGFVPNSIANLDYNIAYDALMLDSREDDLFFIIENDLNKRYIIQGVGTFDDSIELPLGLSITEEGLHTIMLDHVENFNYDVYIKDNLLNTTYNLNESNFEQNLLTGDYLDRYQLVFQPQNVLNVNEFDKGDMSVYYNFNNNIVINNKKSLKLNNVIIYNILGQRMLQVEEELLEGNQILIPFNKNVGVYLVWIESEYGVETYKILKNN